MRAAGILLLATGLVLPAAPPGATIILDGATVRPDDAAEVGGERPARPLRTPGLAVCTWTAVPMVVAWLSLPNRTIWWRAGGAFGRVWLPGAYTLRYDGWRHR